MISGSINWHSKRKSPLNAGGEAATITSRQSVKVNNVPKIDSEIRDFRSLNARERSNWGAPRARGACGGQYSPIGAMVLSMGDGGSPPPIALPPLGVLPDAERMPHTGNLETELRPHR
jgi:hypothetical protein